jgi:ribonuclease R
MTGSLTKPALLALLEREGRPLTTNEAASLAAQHLHVDATRAADRARVERMLDDLLLEGELAFEKGKFSLAKRRPSSSTRAARKVLTKEAVISVHPRGFAFVRLDGVDAFVPAEALGGAMHGDTVEVGPAVRSARGFESAVLRVVKRRYVRVAGTVRRRGRSMWLEPDDARVRGPIVLERLGSAALVPTVASDAFHGDLDGMAAVIELVRYPESPDENPEGRVVEVLGPPGDPKVEQAKILASHAIIEEHPEAAVAEARAFGDHVPAEACVGRVDLTGVPLVTIDPEDARDHDDAIHVSRDADGRYHATIAIADVSHYVRPGTALDEDARDRATSIYLPDRSVPMLPRELSSNLCSLVAGELRLCLAVRAVLSAEGRLESFDVVEGFMKSPAQLTYGGAARTLGFTSEPPRSEEAERYRHDLSVLADLARLLRGLRLRRGALDLDVPEAKLVLDPETLVPTEIEQRTHDPGVKKAYQLVEELMLLANECVAELLATRGVPTIYRVHGAPDPQKLDRFAAMLEQLEIDFERELATDPKKLSVFLKKIGGRDDAWLLHALLLRAMKQAVYDVNNLGHFGLASSAYLHFTSPIRRYPDLVVHRSVRALLRGEKVDVSDEAQEALKLAAQQSSERERRAMEVERDAVELYRMLFLRSRVGQRFTGRVTALLTTGLVVGP